MMVTCERPRCGKAASGDDLYCSDACYERDNDDLMISPGAGVRDRYGFHGEWAATHGRRLPLTARGTLPAGAS